MRRLDYIDNIKCLATFMVIWVHCFGMFLWGTTDLHAPRFLIALFADAVARPCVPLFLMASGVLFFSRPLNLRRFCIHNIALRLTLPFILWWMIYNIFIYGKILNPFNIEQLCYHFPFFYIILIVYVTYPLIYNFVININREHIIYFSIIWLTATMVVFFNSQFNIHFFYLYAGYPAMTFWIASSTKQQYIGKYIYLILFLIFSVVVFYLNLQASIAQGNFTQPYSLYLSPTVILASFCLFLFIKKCGTFIYNNSARKFIMFISNKSFAIYFFHPIILDRVAHSTFYPYISKIGLNAISGLIIFFIVSIISILSVFIFYWLMSKLPFSKYTYNILG